MKRIAAILFLSFLALGARAGKPVIGVSPSYDSGKVSANSSYLSAVERAGGIPLILSIIRL